MYEIYAAGAAAAFTVDCLIYPLDTIKTRYQSQDFIQTYASSSGKRPALFRGLYQGIGSVILATLPAAGLFFATYESTKRTFSRVLPIPQPLVHASASAIAEMVSCLVLAPAEVIKQNAQMLRGQSPGRSKGNRSTSLEALRRITGSGLQRRLWSGYTALVARNLPFTAIQFPIFEHIRKISWQARARRHRNGPTPGLVETGLISGISAGTAGAFAAFVTTPSDVVKTRMMLTAGDSSNTKHEFSQTSSQRKNQRTKGGWDVAREVYNSRGIRGLFRGAGLRATWTAVGSGLYLGTYEISKLWLMRGKAESDVISRV